MTQTRPDRGGMTTGNPAFRESVYSAAGTGTSTMTIGGTAGKALIFTVLLVAAASYGWSLVTPDASGAIVWPWWTWWVLLGAFVVAMITIFRPQSAAITGSIYAILEGLALGAISAIYDAAWNGIIVQAVILTIGVLVAVLLLYLTGVLRGRPRLTRGIMIATGGVALLYLFGIVMALFGVDVAFWAQPTSFGLFWTVVIVGIAALNFVLDFEAIERYSAAGAPKYYEWHAAFGLILTLVWLYLEIIRLIVLTRER